MTTQSTARAGLRLSYDGLQSARATATIYTISRDTTKPIMSTEL